VCLPRVICRFLKFEWLMSIFFIYGHHILCSYFFYLRTSQSCFNLCSKEVLCICNKVYEQFLHLESRLDLLGMCIYESLMFVICRAPCILIPTDNNVHKAYVVDLCMIFELVWQINTYYFVCELYQLLLYVLVIPVYFPNLLTEVILSYVCVSTFGMRIM